jgi:hypothetical protein
VKNWGRWYDTVAIFAIFGEKNCRFSQKPRLLSKYNGSLSKKNLIFSPNILAKIF